MKEYIRLDMIVTAIIIVILILFVLLTVIPTVSTISNLYKTRHNFISITPQQYVEYNILKDYYISSQAVLNNLNTYTEKDMSNLKRDENRLDSILFSN